MNIASKPSERHVFFVDDLDAVKKIEEQLITFVCEAASASAYDHFMFKTEGGQETRREKGLRKAEEYQTVTEDC